MHLISRVLILVFVIATHGSTTHKIRETHPLYIWAVGQQMHRKNQLFLAIISSAIEVRVLAELIIDYVMPMKPLKIIQTHDPLKDFNDRMTVINENNDNVQMILGDDSKNDILGGLTKNSNSSINYWHKNAINGSSFIFYSLTLQAGMLHNYHSLITAKHLFDMKLFIKIASKSGNRLDLSKFKQVLVSPD